MLQHTRSCHLNFVYSFCYKHVFCYANVTCAATSDYRQSLQFRGLNAEKSNIQLKVRTMCYVAHHHMCVAVCNWVSECDPRNVQAMM